MNVDIDRRPNRNAPDVRRESFSLHGRPVHAEVLAEIREERNRSRRRHAVRHLADGERPETVAAWMRIPMEEVYVLMGTMEIDG